MRVNGISLIKIYIFLFIYQWSRLRFSRRGHNVPKSAAAAQAESSRWSVVDGHDDEEVRFTRRTFLMSHRRHWIGPNTIFLGPEIRAFSCSHVDRIISCCRFELKYKIVLYTYLHILLSSFSRTRIFFQLFFMYSTLKLYITKFSK